MTLMTDNKIVIDRLIRIHYVINYDRRNPIKGIKTFEFLTVKFKIKKAHFKSFQKLTKKTKFSLSVLQYQRLAQKETFKDFG